MCRLVAHLSDHAWTFTRFACASTDAYTRVGHHECYRPCRGRMAQALPNMLLQQSWSEHVTANTLLAKTVRVAGSPGVGGAAVVE